MPEENQTTDGGVNFSECTPDGATKRCLHPEQFEVPDSSDIAPAEQPAFCAVRDAQ